MAAVRSPRPPPLVALALGLLACTLLCATASSDAIQPEQIRRPEWPKILVHSETPLRACLRLHHGVKAFATVSSLQSKSGSHSVTYSLVVAGVPSPPTSAALLLGNPCDPLASPKRLLSLSQGTWKPWAYQGLPAWMLEGTVPGSVLHRAVLTNGRAVGGRMDDVHVAYFGNQTVAGRIRLLGVSSL